MKSSNPLQNHLLAALSPQVQERLFSYLELAELPLRAVMYEPGTAMRHVYFPTDSIISMQYLLESGASTAISVVGNEGLLGMNLLMGGDSTPSRSLVQSAGLAYRLPRPRVREEFARHGELLNLMLRYTQSLITQIAQTAVCNRHHSIDQQLCRWLLLSLDRLPHNSVTMTQEFIAGMLGVRRAGVTAAAMRLQQMGVISYGRGRINVLDRERMEDLSCECFASSGRRPTRSCTICPNGSSSRTRATSRGLPSSAARAATPVATCATDELSRRDGQSRFVRQRTEFGCGSRNNFAQAPHVGRQVQLR